MDSKLKAPVKKKDDEIGVLRTLPERQFGGPESGLPPAFIIGQDLAPYLVVGIDLGTTFCRVATFKNNSTYWCNPKFFRALVEDAIGMPADQTELSRSLKHYFFGGKVLIKKADEVLSPSDLLANFLSRVKKEVEDAQQRLLAKAVLIVPARFNHRQRSDLRSAATAAGISVLGLLNEGTAAALHACFLKDIWDGRFLVISNGASSFEASVVHLQDKLLETKTINSNCSLSGFELSKRLAEVIAREYNVATSNELIADMKELKQLLDVREYVNMNASGVQIKCNRDQAAEWLQDYRTEVNDAINKTLSDALVDPEQIDGIILSGLATNCWLIRDLLKDRFPQCGQLHEGVPAAGAAIYAALLVRQAKDWVVWDAINKPVVVAQGTYLREVITTNSPLPINGHAELRPSEQDGSVTATIFQKDYSQKDAPLEEVARITVTEQLGHELGLVDLSVAATADGTLSFSARHKNLDVPLTVIETEPIAEATIVEVLKDSAQQDDGLPD